MNLSLDDALELSNALKHGVPAGVEVGVAPSPPFLGAIAASLKGSTLGLSAQNMHEETRGAFTGESSPAQLADVGCRYVILGHSERRQIFGETDEERWLLHVGRRFIPRVDSALFNIDGLPHSRTLVRIRVPSFKLLPSYTPLQEVLDFFIRWPNIAQEDIITLSVLSNWVLSQIDIHGAGQGIRHNQRR